MKTCEFYFLNLNFTFLCILYKKEIFLYTKIIYFYLFIFFQGPVLPEPLVDPTHLSRLKTPNVEKDLKYVGDAITLTRHKIEGKVPLIGFSGAPVSYKFYNLKKVLVTLR